MVGYNQIFPQVQPLDVGNTLFKIAQLKDAEETRGYRNSLLALQTKEAQQKLDDRNALRTALPGAMSGDADASSQVAAINPDLWMKLDANRKAKIKEDLETTGRLLYAVEQSPDKAGAYQAALAAAQQRGVDVSKAPAQYDSNWVRSRIAEATSLSDQIKLAEGQKPQVVGENGALVDRNGKVLFRNGGTGAGAGGPFKGTGMDAQAWNVLLDPKADPASPAYAAAWSHLNTPKTQVINDPSTNQPTLVTIQPQMPPNIRPPASGAAVPAAAPGAPPAQVPAPAPEAVPAVPVASAAPSGGLGAAAAAEPPPVVPAAPAAPAAAPMSAAPQQIAPGVTSVPVGGAKPVKIPDGQATSAGYANRMTSAEQIIGDIEKKGYNPAGTNAVMARAPGVGNFLASDETQQYRQAASDWIRAKLRKESGAAIGETEMADEFKTYFPQPGDSKAVIAQKKQRRIVATQNLIAESQGGYEKLFGGGKGKSAKAPDAGTLSAAKGAIARGASREAVAKRLEENGFDASGL